MGTRDKAWKDIKTGREKQRWTKEGGGGEREGRGRRGRKRRKGEEGERRGRAERGTEW